MEQLTREPFSAEAVEIESGFWPRLPVDRRFDRVRYHHYEPQNPVGRNNRTISFLLPAWVSNSWYFLHSALLSFRCKLVGADWTSALPDTAKCAPINLALSSFFSHLKIYMNEKPVFANEGLYGYRAYIEQELTATNFEKAGQLRAAGYFEDEYGRFDAENNPGFEDRLKLFADAKTEKVDTSSKDKHLPPKKRKRVDSGDNNVVEEDGADDADDADGSSQQQQLVNKTKWIYKGNEVFFCGLLNHDFNTCTAGILNGIGLRLEFTLAPDKFILQQFGTIVEDAHILLTDIKISIPVAEVEGSYALRVLERLRKEPALYQYRRRTLTPHTILNGTQYYWTDGLFPTHTLPVRLIVGFVTEQAFQGSFATNPYNFKKEFVAKSAPTNLAVINSCNLTINGVHIDAYNEKESQENLDYLKIFDYLGFSGTGIGNSLDLDRFNGGCRFYVFDLTSSLSSSNAYSLPQTREGQTRLSVNFSEQLGENVVAVAYFEWNASIKVDFDRKIETSFLT
jgi:hypothetical protein